MSTPSTSSTPRKRIGITNSQRAALRRHARDHPRLRQAQLAAWYETEYGHKLSQGTISESLSNRFTELDNDITNPAQLDRQKARSEAWPELELALFEWYWRTKDNSPITNALLRTKAEWFWRRLAPYQGMEMPNFSNGWLDRFKKRHNIHRHRVSAATQYSAASGINLPVDTDRDDRFSEGHAADSDTGDGPVGDTYQNQAVPGPSRYPNHSRADGPSHYPMPSQEDAPDNLDDVSNHSDQSGRLETRPLDDVLPDMTELMEDERTAPFHIRSLDEHGEEIAKITTTEALRCLHMLELYELQQEDGQPEFIEALYKYRTMILKRHYTARKQRSTPALFS